jgi:YidC/Oxa1 family membrane protein insertase
MAQQQKMMLYMFPVIYAIGGVSIPIGVLIYWLTTNLWTMGQQYILIHNNPAPGTPAYVDGEDRMRAKGLDPDAIAAKRRGSKKPARQTGDYDPTKVARQNRGAAAAPASGSPESPETVDSSGVQRQVIQRQQPRKNTRAARKQ